MHEPVAGHPLEGVGTVSHVKIYDEANHDNLLRRGAVGTLQPTKETLVYHLSLKKIYLRFFDND